MTDGAVMLNCYFIANLVHCAKTPFQNTLPITRDIDLTLLVTIHSELIKMNTFTNTQTKLTSRYPMD